MNGNITREGITADLEAMARVGVGGAQIFNVYCGIPAGPVSQGRRHGHCLQTGRMEKTGLWQAEPRRGQTVYPARLGPVKK